MFLVTDAFVQGRDHILLISVTHNFLCKEFPSSKQDTLHPPPPPVFRLPSAILQTEAWAKP